VEKKLDVFLRGGLGNQLFQYAAGLYMARKHKVKLVFRKDLLPAEIDSIGGISRWPIQITDFEMEGWVSGPRNQPKDKTHIFSKSMQVQRFIGDHSGDLLLRFGVLAGEKSREFDFQKMNRLRIINSYCGSATPALSLGDTLRNQIRNVINPSDAFQSMLQKAKTSSPIIVHLRLGDYVGLKGLYGEVDLRALGLELERLRNLHGTEVWLFTDSPEQLNSQELNQLKVSQIFGPETLEKPIENLVLMSTGSHIVCANSTFSWWAAFLKGEVPSVSYPSQIVAANKIFSRDMILDGWISYGSN
jgi:hypothetical protein